MKSKITLCCIPLVIVTLCPTLAASELTKVGDSVVDPKALTIKESLWNAINGLSSQQDAVVSHENYQYVTYYDVERHVCLGRRKLPTGRWELIRLTDYVFTGNDSHNTISLGICPKDGTMHLAFDHHGHPLHYRVSKKHVASDPQKAAWDASLFGPITSELEKGKRISLTYPRFWQTPDGGLQFCYRQGGAGNGDRILVDYHPKSGTWVNTRKIDSRSGLFKDIWCKSESRCSYPNGYDYGPHGKLHVTWVWREGSGNANHDLMYAYSEDQGETWLNNKGQALRGPPHVNSPDITVVNIGRGYGLANSSGQAVDSQGRVHAVMWHCTDESLKMHGSKPTGGNFWGPPDARHYHHSWRDANGVWNHRELPWVAGSRPKVFMDKDDNAYLIWGAKQESDQWWSSGWFSKADLMIAAATADSKWTDWKIVHVEKGPFANEMLGDKSRWQTDGILSVMVQDSPKRRDTPTPTPLRILDFSLRTAR